nr:hypothetical protein [Leptolyngbya sp. PCC 6406]
MEAAIGLAAGLKDSARTEPAFEIFQEQLRFQALLTADAPAAES